MSNLQSIGIINNIKFIDFDLYQYCAILIDGMFGKIITIFNTTNQDVYFVAKELAEKLDYFDTRTMYRILDVDEFGSASQANLNKINNLRDLFGEFNPRGMTLVNLSGAFHAAFKSTKPEAQQFRKFVTSIILPQIYKTGYYLVNNNIGITIEQMQSQMIALEDRLVERLQVKFEFGDHGIKIPLSCFDICDYSTYFNSKYNQNIDKHFVYNFLRFHKFITNGSNMMPTSHGIDSKVIGLEAFPIQYKDNSVGKSVKIVVYKNMLHHIDNALMKYIKSNNNSSNHQNIKLHLV